MVGIFFIARLGSARLAEKHLIEVEGKTFIEILTTRFKAEFSHEIEAGSVKMAVVTSHVEVNKKFSFLKDKGICDVFFGNDENIPIRLVEAAEFYGCSSIVSIDGDDILCSPSAARKVFEHLNNDSDQLGKPYKTTGLPFGMNSMGFSLPLLRSMLDKVDSDTIETGWGRIFNDVKWGEIPFETTVAEDVLRFSLDYQEDADFFKTVIQSFMQREAGLVVDDKTIIEHCLQNKWYAINQSVHEKYWQNFNNQVTAESTSKPKA